MTMLDTYGITDEDQRSQLIALSQQVTQLGWPQTYESEPPELYTTSISLFIPDLLQTESYARAVIRGVLPFASDAEVKPGWRPASSVRCHSIDLTHCGLGDHRRGRPAPPGGRAQVMADHFNALVEGR
ncbi:hypothetical protein [Salinispora pacifica]|uniref:hypothetical protein n=1 Tax=Salinispora pacifica TaxID=351187 RepID=UPI0004B3CEB0